MAQPKKIDWSNKAAIVLFEVTTYIDKQFGNYVADKFLREAYDKADSLLLYPEKGKHSKRYKTVRWIKVGKYHRMYYRVQGSVVHIVSLRDVRQDPKNDPYR